MLSEESPWMPGECDGEYPTFMPLVIQRILFIVVALLSFGGTNVFAQTPTLTTGTATGVTDLAATLNGTVNANGGSFYTYFDYGTDTTYGSTTFSTPWNVTGVTAVAVTANPTDLLPNTTYHFRLYTYDSNFSNLAYGTDKTFTTGAPATRPTVNGTYLNYVSATSVEVDAISVWSGSSPVNVAFEYGLTTAYGSAVPYSQTIPTNTSSSTYGILTGLTPGTTYHYRCKATNAQGVTASPDATFTTPGAPVIITSAATAVTDIAATLNGTANASGGSTYVAFDYGLTTSYGSTAYASQGAVSGTSTVIETANPSGLLPSTTYHYRLKGNDSGGTSYYGVDTTFTTAAPATLPSVGNLSSSSLSASTASVRVSSVFAGGSATTVSFEYGTTTAYGATATYSSSVPTNTTYSYLTMDLTGLNPSTTYHYRCKATNAQGTAYSVDASFTSPGAPMITTMAATGITDIAATLNGTANASGGNISVSFEYGASTSYGFYASASQYSVSGTTTVVESAAPSGLLPSTTYHYRLKGPDSSGTYYYGVDMTFTTGAPATPPTVGAPSLSSVAAATASVAVSNIAAGSSPATVVFEYGLTTAYGSIAPYNYTIATNTSGNAYATLGGLTPASIYHYRCKATNTQGASYSVDATFTTLAAPVIVTTAATGVTDLTAMLNGNANPSGGSLFLIFEYGYTTSYGSIIYPASPSIYGSTTVLESVSLPSLSPSTTYHYRLKGYDSGGTYFYGADMTFTTAAAATPPTLGTISSSSVASTSATVSVTSVAAGSSDATVVFEYGPTTSYGSTATYYTISANRTDYPYAYLTGLTPGTIYHFRCRATNSQGAVTSPDGTFTMLQAPVINTMVPTGVTDITATLNGTANPSGGNVAVTFQYGLTPSYGYTVSPSPSSITGTLTLAESVNISGLLPATTYHYRLRGFDGGGSNGMYYSGTDMTFTTATPTTPPTIGAVSTSSVSASKATLRVGSVAAGGSQATVSFEYGVTTAYGTTAAYASAIPTATSVSSLAVSVAGLSPASIYHYRCKAVNAQGITYSGDATFTTFATPVITTVVASGVTDIAATLNGTANASGGTLTVSFDYGLSTAYDASLSPSSPSVTGSSTVSKFVNPPGLLPGTTYYYRMKGVDGGGVTYYGADMTFTTAAPATPPTVGTVSLYSVAATVATVQVSSVASGSSPATVSIEYGPTTAYGASAAYSAIIATNRTVSFPRVTLSGLVPASPYHYRCKAANGQGITYSSDATFSTPAAPLVTTAAATGITDLLATLNGAANPNGGTLQLSFDYGRTTAYGSTFTPSPSYLTGSADTLVSASPAGLLSGTTYHYRLKGYDTGGIYYYGADLTFATARATTPPTFGGASIYSIATTAATLQVSNVKTGSSAAILFLEFGPTAAYGTRVPYAAGSSTTVLATNATYSSLPISINGLTPGATYHYRFQATNSEGTATGSDATFTTSQAPLISTAAATSVSDVSAIFNGSANASGASVSLYFEYGRSASYGSSVNPGLSYITGNATAVVSANKTGLLPNTIYHYRLAGYDGAGIYYYGTDMTFATGPPVTPPVVGTGAASSIGAISATLSATSITTGSSSATLVFEYGLSAAYGSQVAYPSTLAASTSSSSKTVAITGLVPGTTYYFRAKISNAEGTAYGEGAAFTTLPPPVFATGPATGVTDLTATLTGTVNANSGSLKPTFEYGLTAAYGASAIAAPSTVSGTAATNVTFSVPGLRPNTTYHYRLTLGENSGGLFYGADATFTTSPPVTPPGVTTGVATSVTATTAVLNASGVTTGTSPALVVFEYGTTASYGTSVPYITLPPNRSFASLSLPLSGLQPLTTYHYRVKVTNSETASIGTDMAFTTTGLPTVFTDAATNVGDLSATLNGTINPAGVSSTVSFEYGTTTAYNNTYFLSSAISGTTVVAKAVTPLNLQPLTTYHYRLRLDNGDGTYYGADAVFTTIAGATAPTIGGASYGTYGATSAKLNASSVNAGSSAAAIVFEYGPTTAYGYQVAYPSAVPASTALSTASVTVTGLLPGTIYHFRAGATNSEGTGYGPDVIFVTPGVPSVTTGAATGVADVNGVLNGTANANGGVLTLSFEYGTTSAYGSTASPSTSSASGYSIVAPTASLADLLAGTTYHYRLKATDGAGVSYFGADMTFTTGTVATLPTVATGTASAGATTVTLSATNVRSGAAPATLSWDYGTSTAYGSSFVSSSTIASGVSYSSISVGTFTGLSPGTTYHYRAVIRNAQTTVYGADATFTTASFSVSATTMAATRIRSTSATLNGSYSANAGTNAPTFEYGLSTTYGTSVNGTLITALSGTSSAALTGLAPGTIYHYRLINTNPNGTAYGTDMTFSTLDVNAPVAITGTAVGSTIGGATFRGTVNGSGSDTTAVFEYGTTTSYGAVAAALPLPVTGSNDTAVNVNVTGLTANATYHYRVVATSSQGTTYGDDATVQMVQAPVVSTSSATVTSQSATLRGSVTPSGTTTAYFEYGSTTSYGSAVATSFFFSSAFPQSVSAQVGNVYVPGSGYTPSLPPNTTYHYRIVASNAGGTVYGGDVSFTTDYADPSGTYQPVTGITSTNVTLNGTVTEAGGTDAVSFDHGLTTAYGSNGVTTPATASGNGAFPVSLTLTGLAPGTTYHYRIRASHSRNGAAVNWTFTDHTFATLTLAENWRQQFFGSPAAVGNTADDASFAGDGIPNLVKYALGLDPTIATTAVPHAMPKTYADGTYLCFIFPRDPGKTDLTYEVLAADAPDGQWTVIASSIGGAAATGPGLVGESPGANGMLNVEVRDTVSMSSATQRFVRLRVTH